MKNKRSDKPKVCWMQHGCGAEDVDMSLKNKTCQPASGAQDSRASLESPGHREWDASIGSVPDVWKQYEEALHPGASL